MVGRLRKMGWEVDIVTILEEDAAREIGPGDPSLVDSTCGFDVSRVRYRCWRNALFRLRDRLAGVRGRILGPGPPGGGKSRIDGKDEVRPRDRFSKWKDIVTDEILSFPDRHSGWIRSGYVGASAQIRRKGGGIIFASGPPHSTLVIGSLLKKRFRLPLVLEFRDPWVGNPYHEQRSSVFSAMELGLHRGVLRCADSIRASTGHLKSLLISIEPSCGGKIFVGGAGFEDFIGEKPDAGSLAPEEPFTIVHAGTLYAQRNPGNFLRAVRRILSEGVIPDGGIRIRLFGGGNAAEQEIRGLRRDPLLSSVVETSDVPHDVCVEAMLKSDLLLALQQGTMIQVPAKIYEYLSLGRPMMTIADKGSATWDLIRGEGFGDCVVDEPGEIYGALRKAYLARAGNRGQRYYPNAEKFGFTALSATFNSELERLRERG